uniref:Sas10 C-terminal domain-containing protein n=1 Tax=Opuntia streptacantha TaxID=393608 RepID=A0A7C9DSV9_OPUST
MGKRGENRKKGPRDSKKIKLRDEDVGLNDMDDEIDAFHKERDMIPLDINADVESEDDDEHPVFDYEGIGDENDDDEDEDEDDEDDYSNLKGLAAKIARQQKYLNEKFGGAEDEMHDDSEEEDKKKGTVWSSKKHSYYDAENKDYELQSSDEDTPAEEEEEVIKLQKERAQFLREEDFGLQTDDQDDSDEEPTLGEMMVKGKTISKSAENEKAEGDSAPIYEEVKKDLNALSRDEQMDVLQSSAPELVGLLGELNDAMNQLETHVNPLIGKIKKGDNAKKEGMHYLEVKQLLLLAYCQAITFYLLLKSEGQPVRDHPVIARLVEIKSLLDTMKELDGHIPNGVEDLLNENGDINPAKKPAAKEQALTSDLHNELNRLTGPPSDKHASKDTEKAEPVKMHSRELNEKKRQRDKCKEDPVSSESVKMLQYRAALEEKLKLKVVSGSIEPKTDRSRKQKPKKLTGQLETADDFDDEAMDLEGTARNNGRSSTLTSKVSKFIGAQDKTRKGVSGDDDLPERDDLGERRWKHELRVLAGAGLKSVDDDDPPENEPDSDGADVNGNRETENSEDDFYNQVKQKRAAKRAVKAGKYSRNPGELYEPDTTVGGKRHITTQMEKNRGLTRPRKKEIKNPRKKYSMKYAKAAKRRKGQVQDIRKPKGLSYDGETHGINARVSRSIRL